MSWRSAKQQLIELFMQQSHLNFNHHEVIPQLPEGQHHDAQHHFTAQQLHCEATSLSRQGKSHRGGHLEFGAALSSA